MKTSFDTDRPQLSFGRTTKTLATFALICGLSLSAHAQLGSGWKPDNETYVPQTSAGTSITAIPGGYEFRIPTVTGLCRAEMRGNELPTNVTNQWQGFATLRSLPSGSGNICMHQVFGPTPSTPDLILDEAVGGPTGIEIMSVEQNRAFEAAIQVGVQFQMNTIYDPVGNLITIYVNGSKTGTKVPNGGVHYNKYGQYVSLSGSGPSTLDWVNVQSWSGGTVPGSTPAPAPAPAPAPTPAPSGGVTAVALRALANNMYVCADNYGNNPLIANRTSVGTWETFDQIDLGNGNIALRAHVNNKYVCADNAGSSPLIANRTAVGGWETYHKEAVSGGYALKSLANNMYVCADNYGNNPLIANRTSPSTWETFVFVNE